MPTYTDSSERYLDKLSPSKRKNNVGEIWYDIKLKLVYIHILHSNKKFILSSVWENMALIRVTRRSHFDYSSSDILSDSA